MERSNKIIIKEKLYMDKCEKIWNIMKTNEDIKDSNHFFCFLIALLWRKFQNNLKYFSVQQLLTLYKAKTI